jgi:hypothetical protein
MMAQHLFLPLIGWRWALGIVPIVALYGASANEQVGAPRQVWSTGRTDAGMTDSLRFMLPV